MWPDKSPIKVVVLSARSNETGPFLQMVGGFEKIDCVNGKFSKKMCTKNSLA